MVQVEVLLLRTNSTGHVRGGYILREQLFSLQGSLLGGHEINVIDHNQKHFLFLSSLFLIEFIGVTLVNKLL